ncbi:SseB family protein [Streptomyces sp. NP160]|uniref:SseB family protein n=1 Tax=Streptomyces sp. NP160 TaxID=2586637 RepID=UPI00214CC5E9|nr:SseB family protein [Streptomyces sp. NP160]
MDAGHPPHGGAHLPGRHGDAHGDSAGTPWAGRTLTDSPFAGDDGSLAPALAAVLDAARASGEPVDVEALITALPGARLFVPVTAVSAGTDEATGGDLGADMAIPTLRSPDGRDALPVFTSVAALTAWSSTARPVPVEARRAAVSAVQEGQQLLVLDPGVEGAAGSVVVPRPALWALAKGEPWTPSWRDPEVAGALERIAARMGGVVEITSTRGPGAGGAGELRVTVRLSAGAGAHEEWARRTFGEEAGRDPVLAERVDSVLLVTEELPRAVIVVQQDPNWPAWMARWHVSALGQTLGARPRTGRSTRSRRSALALAARWCEEDGGHQPAADGRPCRWCPAEG